MVEMDCQIRQINIPAEGCFPARILEKNYCETVCEDGLRAGTKKFPPVQI